MSDDVTKWRSVFFHAPANAFIAVGETPNDIRHSFDGTNWAEGMPPQPWKSASKVSAEEAEFFITKPMGLPMCRNANNEGALQWTREPPTTKNPGWYWVRMGDQTMMVLVSFPRDLTKRMGAVHFDADGDPWPITFASVDLWAGPIEAPPLPEGT
jgi:hypothetical protein